MALPVQLIGLIYSHFLNEKCDLCESYFELWMQKCSSWSQDAHFYVGVVYYTLGIHGDPLVDKNNAPNYNKLYEVEFD